MSAGPATWVTREEQLALLQQEQARLATKQVMRMPLLLLMVDIGCVAVAWRAGALYPALIWLAVISVVQVSRSRYVAHLHRQQAWPPARMLRFLSWSLAAQGLVNTFIVVIIFQYPDEMARYVVSIIMIGVAAGCITPAAGHVPIYGWWALGFWSLLGGSWLMQGTLEGVVLAVLLVTLLALFMLFVRDQGRSMLKMVVLTESLRRERDRAERERQRAHAANEARTRFFAAASHDLRQPLHALGINAATVQVLAQQTGNATLQQVSEVIRRALGECRGLLDSLLEISELDAGAVKPDLRAVGLDELLQQVHRDCLPLAHDKGLQLTVQAMGAEGQALAWSDAGLLARMLRNLVGNAIKFTAAGWVRLSVRPAQSGDQALWVIEVSDSGPGIAASDLDKVFEEFYQVGNSERDRSRGLGLGLAIVRRLGLLVGCEVTVRSQLGQGTTFSLSLPQAASGREAGTGQAATEAVAVPATAAEAIGWRVLIVDDEREVRASLCTFLGVMGLQVRAVASGDEALGLLDEGWWPDAMVLDFRLQGGSSGLDVLARLRQRGCEAPAMLVTGDTAPQRIQAAQAAGLPLLYKPVDGMQLLATIQDLVQQASAQPEQPIG